MNFFESLVVLMLAAILLLQVSRRLTIPYPTMLAAAGVLLAMVPGTPSIRLEPQTALALFIAPALIDAAYDFPVHAVWRLWRQLVALAVVAVLLTAGAVAWLGMAYAGLPLYAALALGAIVAPPDAVAAVAILGTVALPRRAIAVLKGESLLNDAVALLLFSAAVQVQQHGSLDASIALRLALEVPGGLGLGIAIALLYRRLARFVVGTLGGNLLEFVSAFAIWIVAEHLHVSAVLCVVGFAMTIARQAGLRQPARARVHSFAVWETVVFLLNVVAFLLMGMQTRLIVGSMAPDRLREAAVFALLVIAIVIGVRLVWVIGYNRLARHVGALRGNHEPASLKQGLLVGWSGMRGLITLATAFALPAAFPQRDIIVLAAFAVVLATLVLQGLTLVPLVRWLEVGGDDTDGELSNARKALAKAALGTLDQARGAAADHLRWSYQAMRNAEDGSDVADAKRALGLAAIQAQRERLEELRRRQDVDTDGYLVLQEELDFRELAITSEDERAIEET